MNKNERESFSFSWFSKTKRRNGNLGEINGTKYVLFPVMFTPELKCGSHDTLHRLTSLSQNKSQN